MDRADMYNNVYEELSGVYTSGMFGLIENKLSIFWDKILVKEEELNINWDNVTDEQFGYIRNVLKRLMLEAIMRSKRV